MQPICRYEKKLKPGTKRYVNILEAYFAYSGEKEMFSRVFKTRKAANSYQYPDEKILYRIVVKTRG